MRLLNKNFYVKLVNDSLIDYRVYLNISYWWNIGVFFIIGSFTFFFLYFFFAIEIDCGRGNPLAACFNLVSNISKMSPAVASEVETYKTCTTAANKLSMLSDKHSLKVISNYHMKANSMTPFSMINQILPKTSESLSVANLDVSKHKVGDKSYIKVDSFSRSFLDAKAGIIPESNSTYDTRSYPSAKDIQDLKPKLTEIHKDKNISAEDLKPLIELCEEIAFDMLVFHDELVDKLNNCSYVNPDFLHSFLTKVSMVEHRMIQFLKLFPTDEKTFVHTSNILKDFCKEIKIVHSQMTWNRFISSDEGVLLDYYFKDPDFIKVINETIHNYFLRNGSFIEVDNEYGVDSIIFSPEKKDSIGFSVDKLRFLDPLNVKWGKDPATNPKADALALSSKTVFPVQLATCSSPDESAILNRGLHKVLENEGPDINLGKAIDNDIATLKDALLNNKLKDPDLAQITDYKKGVLIVGHRDEEMPEPQHLLINDINTTFYFLNENSIRLRATSSKEAFLINSIEPYLNRFSEKYSEATKFLEKF